MTRTAGDNLAATILGIVDEAFHCIEAARVCERTKRDAFLETVTELETLCIFGKTRHELAVVLFVHIEARRRDADLAGIAILERRNGVGRLLRISIFEHDDGRMPAELHGCLLHATGRELGQMLADRP